MKHDPIPYVLKELEPILEKLFDRLECDLSERDGEALAEALLEAATAGFGEGWDHLKFTLTIHGADPAVLLGDRPQD